MRIWQDQFLQHIDRCLLKLRNGDLPKAELSDSIGIPPENLNEIQNDSGIAIREFLRHCVKKYFLTLMQTSNIRSYSGS